MCRLLDVRLLAYSTPDTDSRGNCFVLFRISNDRYCPSKKLSRKREFGDTCGWIIENNVNYFYLWGDLNVVLDSS